MIPQKQTYTAIIVDDNEIDRLHTQLHLKQYPFVNMLGAYASAEEALIKIKDKKIDILFLDIDMPDMNGMQLRKEIGENPVCIFITSYPDYAVDTYDLAALDFLVKPLKKDRFEKTMSRLQDYLELKHKAALFDGSLGTDAIFIKEGYDRIKIQLHDILYLEALKDYTRIVTVQKKYCVLTMLGQLLQEKTFQTFVRVHRSYAVQKHFISKITSQQVFVNDISLPLGRSYKDAIDLLTEN